MVTDEVIAESLGTQVRLHISRIRILKGEEQLIQAYQESLDDLKTECEDTFKSTSLR